MTHDPRSRTGPSAANSHTCVSSTDLNVDGDDQSYRGAPR